MTYTSYYANYRKFKGMFRVSISRTAPSNSCDIQLIKLAPTVELLQKYKCNSITKFVKALSTLQELQGDVVLLCYEKKGDFCHRHLLAEYLNNNHNTNIREL